MAMTSADVIGLLTPGLKTAFFDTYNEMGHQWQDVATLIPSEKDTEHYAWLGALPGVNEFKDERQTGDFTEYEYAIKNKKWESTVEVDRDTLEDDLYGQIAIKVKTMASSANQHLDLLVYGLLGAGFTAPCYDGAAMFGPHVQKQFTQTNRGTDPLSSASLQSAITQMMRFTDDQGRPMGVMPDKLVVPPELYWEAAVLMNSAFFPDPLSSASQNLAMNPLKGLLSLTTTPYLSNTQDWFLLDTKRVVKATVLQMRKEFEFDALEVSSETGFWRDKFAYGVRARYNAGYGDWRAAFGSHVG